MAQKADESNDSYISRHDMAFEELLSRKTTLEEVRAYILLRHSQLAPEDKKRVVVEAQGDLKYKDTVKQIRLLGSRFLMTSITAEQAKQKGEIATRCMM